MTQPEPLPRPRPILRNSPSHASNVPKDSAIFERILAGAFPSPLKSQRPGIYQARVRSCYRDDSGACLLPGRIAIGDGLTALIGLASLVALFRCKVSNPLLILATAIAGLVACRGLQPAWVMVK